MTNGDNSSWGVFVLGMLFTVACLVLDWELLVHKPEPCLVDGNDPFRGAFMHLVRDPRVSCTSEDDKARLVPVGTTLECMVLPSAHGSICIGGAELDGRKSNAWAFMGLSLFVLGLGLFLGLASVYCSSQREYVREVFHGDELPLDSLASRVARSSAV